MLVKLSDSSQCIIKSAKSIFSRENLQKENTVIITRTPYQHAWCLTSGITSRRAGVST